MTFLLVSLAAIAWSVIALVAGFIVAVLVRIGNAYPEGESFGRWVRRIWGWGTLAGWGLALTLSVVGYIYKVREGEVPTPEWVTALLWFVAHWWLIPMVAAAVVTGFLIWRHIHNRELNQEYALDYPPPAVDHAPVTYNPAPAFQPQPIWSTEHRNGGLGE